MSIPVFHVFRPEKQPVQHLPPAGMKERMTAQLIDGIFLGAVISALLALYSRGAIYSVWISPLIPVYVVQPAAGYVPQPADWWWGGYFTTVSLRYLADFHVAYPSPLQWLIYAVYYTGFHAWFGQTPGKMMKGIVVLNDSGGRLTLPAAFLRWIASIGALIPAGYGFWRTAGKRGKRAWQDALVRTRVVRFMFYEN